MCQNRHILFFLSLSCYFFVVFVIARDILSPPSPKSFGALSRVMIQYCQGNKDVSRGIPCSSVLYPLWIFPPVIPIGFMCCPHGTDVIIFIPVVIQTVLPEGGAGCNSSPDGDHPAYKIHFLSQMATSQPEKLFLSDSNNLFLPFSVLCLLFFGSWYRFKGFLAPVAEKAPLGCTDKGENVTLA